MQIQVPQKEQRTSLMNVPLTTELMTYWAEGSVQETAASIMDIVHVDFDGPVSKMSGLEQWGQKLKYPDATLGIACTDYLNNWANFSNWVPALPQIPILLRQNKLYLTTTELTVGSVTVYQRIPQPSDGTSSLRFGKHHLATRRHLTRGGHALTSLRDAYVDVAGFRSTVCTDAAQWVTFSPWR